MPLSSLPKCMVCDRPSHFLFRIPREPVVRDKWFKNLDLHKNLEIALRKKMDRDIKVRICEKHFGDESLVLSDGNKLSVRCDIGPRDMRQEHLKTHYHAKDGEIVPDVDLPRKDTGEGDCCEGNVARDRHFSASHAQEVHNPNNEMIAAEDDAQVREEASYDKSNSAWAKNGDQSMSYLEGTREYTDVHWNGNSIYDGLDTTHQPGYSNLKHSDYDVPMDIVQEETVYENNCVESNAEAKEATRFESGCGSNAPYIDENGREVMIQTTRKYFMVQLNQLLELFVKRCPTCGTGLQSLAISSNSTMPVVAYKCTGKCGISFWFGQELE